MFLVQCVEDEGAVLYSDGSEIRAIIGSIDTELEVVASGRRINAIDVDSYNMVCSGYSGLILILNYKILCSCISINRLLGLSPIVNY